MATETKCPFNHAAGEGTSNRDWWPNQLKLKILHQHSSAVRSHGQGLQLCRSVQEPRPGSREEGPAGADDQLAGLVAGGLRPLRAFVHSHGVAQRRNVPHRRRSRRRRIRPAALRAAQQLARQRQPRQGAPADLADQAEVWQQDFMGRPDDPHRQRRAGIDGLQDLRFRRRTRGRLGAGRGRLLGHREDLAGRRHSLRQGTEAPSDERRDRGRRGTAWQRARSYRRRHQRAQSWRIRWPQCRWV